MKIAFCLLLLLWIEGSGTAAASTDHALKNTPPSDATARSCNGLCPDCKCNSAGEHGGDSGHRRLITVSSAGGSHGGVNGVMDCASCACGLGEPIPSGWNGAHCDECVYDAHPMKCDDATKCKHEGKQYGGCYQGWCVCSYLGSCKSSDDCHEAGASCDTNHSVSIGGDGHERYSIHACVPPAPEPKHCEHFYCIRFFESSPLLFAVLLIILVFALLVGTIVFHLAAISLTHHHLSFLPSLQLEWVIEYIEHRLERERNLYRRLFQIIQNELLSLGLISFLLFFLSNGTPYRMHKSCVIVFSACRHIQSAH